MWPPKWIGEFYVNLYVTFKNEAFYFEDALSFAKSASTAKAVLSRLRKVGAVYVHEWSNRKRVYRLCDPEALVYILSGRICNLWKLKQGRYGRLIGLASAETLRRFGSSVRSIVAYGSIARGVARKDSDVDLLVIMETTVSLGRRLEALSKIESSERVKRELDWLYGKGVDTNISFLPLSPKEAEAFPPILLDIIDEGVALFDDGFYRALVEEKKEALSKLGAKRVFISKDEWFWDLKPKMKLGEVIEI